MPKFLVERLGGDEREWIAIENIVTFSSKYAVMLIAKKYNYGINMVMRAFNPETGIWYYYFADGTPN